LKGVRALTKTKRLVRIPASLLAALIMVAAVLCVAPLEVRAAEDPVNYIYFDLAAGDIQITKTTYSGYVFEYGTDTKKAVTGDRDGQNDFYVYQTTTANRSTTGWKEDGTIVLPEYTPVTYNGKAWGEYITNHPQHWGAETDDSSKKSGSYSVMDVIQAWKTAVGNTREATPNRITIGDKLDGNSGDYSATENANVGTLNIVIDNIWSSYQIKGQYRKSGAIGYAADQKKNNTVTIKLKGDNRLPNIYYHSHSGCNTKLIFQEYEQNATLTVANHSTTSNGNYWGAAIGGSDNAGDQADGIVIESGIIYAGTTAADDCTAIGGGGNGYGGITIKGGTVTAVATSSGAAIGGGIGKSSNGGQATVNISGGNVYAYNYSCVCPTSYTYSGIKTYIPSAAIGGGSSGKSVCKECTVTISGDAFVYAQSVGGTAIGGGSSADTTGGKANITISGNATVYANSVGGTIGGKVVEAGVGIGGGTGGTGPNNMDGSGGNVTLTVKDQARVYTGSIGGGSTNNPAKSKIGAATVIVSGGSIQGQVVMAAGAATGCSFTMSGGMINNLEHDNNAFKFVQSNGGAVYMDDPNGIVNISGGEIFNCSAENGGAIFMTAGTAEISNIAIIRDCSATQNGGAIYMGGGTLTMSGGMITQNTAQNGGAAYLAGTGSMSISGGTLTTNTAAVNGGAAYLAGGTLEISGTATITANQAQNGGAAYLANGTVTVSGGTLSNNQATENGGAAYLGGGTLTIEDGTLSENKAINGNGGAAYVQGGDFIINDGTVTACTAAQKGGAVYVSGGDANVNGGTLTGCSANEGGAIYVEGGTVTMLGGQITDNHALAGNGGAIYVTGDTALNVTVQSGEISGNTATGNGGAICVVGKKDQTNAITVQIGVNELHYDANGVMQDCDHNGDDLEGLGTCPVVKDNTCVQEGGAIYITGTNQTNLNIYCITESGNRGDGREANSEKTGLSDFLKVDGGNVLISAETSDPDAPEDQKIYYGNSVINSSVHVTGGNLTVSGTLTNPAIFAPITVDVVESGGSYTDQRVNDKRTGQTQYYVVRYFENFKAEGSDKETGQYTVHQTPTTEPHTVWGVIYNHAGKTIVGWNTQKDGKGETFGVSTVVEYEDFKGFIPDNSVTLSLYAIWADNFYWIQFDPNTESFSGSMSEDDNKISFLCAAENAPLPENQFVNRSYKFVGWATSPSGDKMYDDQQLLEKALTQEVGKIITFYAVWEICDHENEAKFVFAKVDDSSMSCTCECAYVVTATIVAPTGARYDGKPHPARISYSNDNGNSFTEAKITAFTNLAISYQYTPVEDNHPETGDITEAGAYDASAQYGDIIISVSFRIAQATQTAPEKPTFTASGNILMIDSPEKTTGPAETTILYKLVHHDSTSNQLVEVGPQEDRVFQSFDASWALYYIAAFYPGNNNYLESHEATSDQKYLFQGDIGITITYTAGMTTELVKNGEEASLVSEAWPDYYISSGYNATVEGSLTLNDETLTGTALEAHFNRIENAFAYSISSFQKSYSGNITITFTGAKKKPTVDTYVAPNENFGAISNTPTTVSQDSAFTAYFEVNYYDPLVYGDLTLSFDQALPAGATVIMIDKTDGSYWYAHGGSEAIKLASFKKMGGGDETRPEASDASLKYQFIVDFSDESISQSSLTFELKATVVEKEKEYAPDLQEDPGSVSFTSVSHRMETPVVDGASATVEFGYAQGSAPASKWADREPTLVLSPKAGTVLPIDASIKVIEMVGTQTKTTTATRDDQDNFAITLDPDATSLEIILQSQMFGADTYYFDVQLYAAYEGDAPMNGIPLVAAKELSLQSQPKAQNAAKITVDENKKVFNLNDTITVNIEAKIAEGYTATVTLLSKNNDDGVYASTGHSKNLTTGVNTFEISNLKESFGEGIFCVSVVIRDKANTAVLTVPYYLIIQDQSS